MNDLETNPWSISRETLVDAVKLQHFIVQIAIGPMLARKFFAANMKKTEMEVEDLTPMVRRAVGKHF